MTDRRPSLDCDRCPGPCDAEGCFGCDACPGCSDCPNRDDGEPSCSVCPECGGRGEVEEGTGYPSDEGGEMSRVVPCPACSLPAPTAHDHPPWSEDCTRCDGTGCGRCAGSEAAARATAWKREEP